MTIKLYDIFMGILYKSTILVMLLFLGLYCIGIIGIIFGFIGNN